MKADDLPPLQLTLEQDLEAVLVKIIIEHAAARLKESPSMDLRKVFPPEIRGGKTIYRYGK